MAEPRSFSLPIVDHHAHLRPGASGIASAREFARAGGTHLFLATQNYLPRPPRTREEYLEQFRTTETIAADVARETGVRVFCVLAPYPIDLVHVAPELGLEAAEALQLRALEDAAREVAEGRAVALGEVGRAHFPVDPPVGLALERVLDAALRTAKETHCPAVLHTEDLDPTGYRALSETVRKSGLPLERAVKHYARTFVPGEDRAGLVPSFLAKREVVRAALDDPGPWFLETDFLDDPARPGVALPLHTIPRRVNTLLAPGASRSPEEVQERLTVPFVESPRRIYGLDLSRETPWRPGGE